MTVKQRITRSSQFVKPDGAFVLTSECLVGPVTPALRTIAFSQGCVLAELVYNELVQRGVTLPPVLELSF